MEGGTINQSCGPRLEVTVKQDNSSIITKKVFQNQILVWSSEFSVFLYSWYFVGVLVYIFVMANEDVNIEVAWSYTTTITKRSTVNEHTKLYSFDLTDMYTNMKIEKSWMNGSVKRKVHKIAEL